MTAVRPKFRRPPVIEQAITVVFDELAGFQLGDFGLFWSLIEEAFPTCEHAPRLSASIEQFDLAAPGEFRIVLRPGEQLPRAVYRNGGTGEAVQVQSDRFTYNWAREGGTPYPHSEQTVARFNEMFGIFERFALDRGLGVIAIRQAEITNVNIIPVADFGSTWGDAPWAFTIAPIDPEADVVEIEQYGFDVRHRIMSNGAPVGRLHSQLEAVIKNDDQSYAYKLDLTARSAQLLGGKAELPSFFDIARSAINAVFLGSTTHRMREKWEPLHDR